MMRSRFDEELNDLNSELILMGALCEDAISHAVTALMEDSEEMRNKVFTVDGRIDAKEHDIESRCLRLLLRQQPVARDLRQISSALRMISADSSCGEAALDLLMIAKYLERIGDHATNIAEWVYYAVTGEYKGEEL